MEKEEGVYIELSKMSPSQVYSLVRYLEIIGDIADYHDTYVEVDKRLIDYWVIHFTSKDHCHWEGNSSKDIPEHWIILRAIALYPFMHETFSPS